jgi:O-antigen/teichoic acid export membrane protein
MIMGAGAIADGWLKVQRLPLEEVRRGIMLMAIIVALRWIGGLYRGAISGFEQLVWLSGLDVAIMTVRVVLVVPLFIYIGTSPTAFFSFQLVLAAIELLLLADRAYRLLPRAEIGQRVAWQWASLRAVLKFAVSSSFVGSLWVLATQTDKLLLSKLLPLTDYGHFTLGVLLASGVTVISAPISAALLPRLTRLSAEGDDAGMVRLYRNATQLVGMIAVPAALVLAFFAEQVLWAWTGDPVIVRGAAPVLVLYALGNGVLALGAFAYYLQFAKGDLKLHLICNTLFVVLLIPALIWATSHYGVAGAGYAWVGSNTAFFLLCMPKVHRRFVKGLHRQWLLHDVSGIILATAAGAVLLDRVATWPRDRLSAAIEIAVVSAVLVAIAATGSSWARQKVIGRWSERFAR